MGPILWWAALKVTVAEMRRWIGLKNESLSSRPSGEIQRFEIRRELARLPE
jgi:hypothetical protein